MKENNHFKLNWFIILFLFSQISCTSDKSKNHLSSIIKVCDNTLFVEKYLIVGGGAFGGDRISDYLTDSTTFRLYVGSFIDSHEVFNYACKNDSIYIEKIETKEEGIPYNTKSIIKVINKRVFSLKTLREEYKIK